MDEPMVEQTRAAHRIANTIIEPHLHRSGPHPLSTAHEPEPVEPQVMSERAWHEVLDHVRRGAPLPAGAAIAMIREARALTDYASHHAVCAAQRRREGEAQQRSGRTDPFVYSCSCGLDALLSRYRDLTSAALGGPPEIGHA